MNRYTHRLYESKEPPMDFNHKSPDMLQRSGSQTCAGKKWKTHRRFRGIEWKGVKNSWSSKCYIFHPFQALYCRARCADYKKVSYVGVGPSKVGQKRAKLLIAGAS